MMGASIGVAVGKALEGLVIIGAGIYGAERTGEILSSKTTDMDNSKESEKVEDKSCTSDECNQCPPTEKGKEVFINRGGSAASKRYQSCATGMPIGVEFLYNGVHFDGFKKPMCALLEAKDHYKQFIDKNGKWKSWFVRTGAEKMLEEAERQEKAAQPMPPVKLWWLFSEPEVKNIIQKTFDKEGLIQIQCFDHYC